MIDLPLLLVVGQALDNFLVIRLLSQVLIGVIIHVRKVVEGIDVITIRRHPFASHPHSLQTLMDKVSIELPDNQDCCRLTWFTKLIPPLTSYVLHK